MFNFNPAAAILLSTSLNSLMQSRYNNKSYCDNDDEYDEYDEYNDEYNDDYDE